MQQGDQSSASTLSAGKGMSSFFNSPKQIDQVIREGYIQQQASLPTQDQQAVRAGDWDSKIPGFDLTRHVLQNAESLVNEVQTG